MKSLRISKPHVIIMVGIHGSGKSFFAEHFADTFKAPIISNRSLRNIIYTIPTYSKDEDLVVNNVANHILLQALKTGQTVVYDGFAGSRTERALMTKNIHESGYEPLFVWVQTDAITAKKRATKPKNKMDAISEEIFDSMIKKFSPPHANEKAIVISGKHTYTNQIKIVLKRLADSKPAHIEHDIIQTKPAGRSILVN